MKQAIKITLSSLALTWFALIILRSDHGFNQRLKAWAYDSCFSLGSWAQSTLEDSPVIIAYLDTETYLSQGQDPSLPFSRELHAKALDRLTQIGVAGVVYDIIFGGPNFSGNDVEDHAFAAAIERNSHVVLGADLIQSSVASVDGISANSRHLELPYLPLRQAATDWGLVQYRMDPDFVVREYFPGSLADDQPSLAHSGGRLLGFSEERLVEPQMLYYYGKPYTIPHISLRSLLETDSFPPEAIQGKTIFIGARPATPVFDERRDEARSPYGTWGAQELFMPGVEVHATQLLNLIRGDGVKTPSFTLSALLLLATAIGMSTAAFRLSIRSMFALSLAAFLGIGLAAIYLFHAHHLALPWTHAALLQLPIVLSGNIVGRSTRWYSQRRAFLRAKALADAKIREQATLLDRAHDAIVVLTVEGQHVYHNESARRLFSAATETDSTDSNRLPHWDALPSELKAEALSTTLRNKTWEGEFEIATESESAKKIETRWTQIRASDGSIQSIMAISADVTQKRLLEQQLLQSQRLDTIGSLAGGVAHDLNNALSPILMGVQLLRRQSPSEKATRMLDVMEQSTQRGAEMVRQILAFTRGSGEDRQSVDLKSLTDDLVHLVKETFPKNIEVSSYAASDLWPLQANPTQIHQVLLNLCVNARDAMPDGGHLTIAVDNHSQKSSEPATIGVRKPGDYLLLILSDTGSGMPSERVQKIFDPFYSTKAAERGTGLGLTTVKTIIEKYDGFLEISSELGKGTTFEIYLPAHHPSVTASSRAPETATPIGGGQTILIADDEQAVREMLGSTLEASGYNPILTSNGVEAIKAIQSAGVDLAILDDEMPIMSGLECSEEIQRQQPDLPVILVSGLAANGDPKQDETSFLIKLPKPFQLDTLLHQIDKMISSR